MCQNSEPHQSLDILNKNWDTKIIWIIINGSKGVPSKTNLEMEGKIKEIKEIVAYVNIGN